MDVAIADWERRKAFVGFTGEDIDNLKALAKLLKDGVDEVVDELYEHFLKFGELEDFLDNQELIGRLKGTQKTYFRQLLEGEYGEEYMKNRIRVGRAHQRIGLSVHWYMGSFLIYQQLIARRINQIYRNDPDKTLQTIASLQKLVTLDQELAITTYIEAREEVIAQQSDEILELSTPVIQVWKGIVAAPVIGTMDSHRTQMFMERLLESIVETRSPVALVDITGVPAIDTATAQHLIDTINAVRLLGAQVIITGISPSIAQTLVHLGISLAGILTRSSLAAGLEVAMDILKLEVRPKQIEGVANV